MTVDSTHLNSNVMPSDDEHEMTLLDIYDIVARRRWWIFASLVIVITAGMIWSLTRQKIYQADASLLFSTQRTLKGDDIPLFAELQALTQNRSVETMSKLLASHDLQLKAFNTFSPQYRLKYFGSCNLPDWVVNVEVIKNTDIIIMSTKAYTREAAEEFANQIIGAFFERDLETNRLATREARICVEQNIQELRLKLDDVNRTLAKVKRTYGMIAPEEQLTLTAKQMASLQEDLDAQHAERQAEDERNHQLYAQLARENPLITASTTLTQNPELTSLRSQLDALYSERALLAQTYTSTSKQMVSVQARIDEVATRMRGVVEQIVATTTQTQNPVRNELKRLYAISETQLAALDARIRALESMAKQQRTLITALPERERQITELIQQQALYQSTYSFLTQRLQTLLMSEKSTLPNGQIIDRPHANLHPLIPRNGRNLVLSLLLALLIAVIVVMIVERLDDCIHDHLMAERLLRLPVLTTIPLLAVQELHLLSDIPHQSSLLEAFRILRNNLAFVSLNHPLNILALVSAGPGEGKTFSCANLAIAFALDGKKVIIVDSDLYKPSIHTYFQTRKQIGITNVVIGTHTLEDAIENTSNTNIDILSSGPLPPNPTELLNSAQCRNVFSRLADMYDIVLVDCPPSLKMSDIQVIATIVDALILLVAIDRTSSSGIRHMVNTLAMVHAPLLGMAINFVDMQKQRYSNYGKYAYGNYAYSSHNEQKRKANVIWARERQPQPQSAQSTPSELHDETKVSHD